MSTRVVGRQPELDATAALLDDGAPALRALVIDGEAGIGKTTVWRAGVDEARARGLTVLVAQPAQAEATLPYAALGDVLRPLLDARLDDLPSALRYAVEVALQLTSAADPPSDTAVARATLALLSHDEAPTLLAVDDVQWLDGPSARALEFALRRLDGTRIRALVARRSEHALPAPLGLARALSDDRLVVRRLAPLAMDELNDLLRERLGVRLLRPRLAQLREASGGNPFYALEIMRASEGREKLALPASLRDALEERLRRLRPEARTAVLLTAAAMRPTSSLIERAAGTSEGLTEAVAAEVLDVDGDRLRFTHPLLASVAYESAAPWEQRRAHRRLAAIASGEERAWNLALGYDEPDLEVALELDQAVAAATARGGFDAAAQLAEHAARVTPSEAGDDRARRLVRAAELHRDAGDHARARDLLEQLVAELTPGPMRARVLHALSTVSFDTPQSIGHCRRAIDEAQDDPLLQSTLHAALAAYVWIAGEPDQSVAHSRRAVEAAEKSGDAPAIATSIGLLCYIQALRADPWDGQLMDRALALEAAATDGFPDISRPSYQLGVVATYTDDLARARPLLEAELRRLDSAGRIVSKWIACWRLTQCELKAGRWAEALRYARAALHLVLQTGGDSEIVLAESTLALVLAHLGQLQEAEAHAERALRSAEEERIEYRLIPIRGALGFIAVSREDYETALAHLAPAREALEQFGMRELSPYAVVENEIEALVALGRLDEAEALVALVADAGEPADRAWHRAIAARGRALVASAHGDADAARAAVRAALAAHEHLPLPFELGRTLLAQGQIERRAKSRAAARDALTRALEVFDELGAALWAERAAAELARIPGRTRSSGELTETERQIAELVATGLSNKEVAARLFVTVRTVEANLTKVYAKLGVRSRGELASRLRG